MSEPLPDLRYARHWLMRTRNDLRAMRDFFAGRDERAYANLCGQHIATLDDIIDRAIIAPRNPNAGLATTRTATETPQGVAQAAGISRGLVIELMREHWQDPAAFHEAVAERLSIDESEYDPPRAWRYELEREVVDAAARLARYYESRGPTMAAGGEALARDRDTQLIARAIAEGEGEAIRDDDASAGPDFASNAQRAAWLKYAGTVNPATAEVRADGTIVARRFDDDGELCVFAPDGSRVRFERTDARP